MVMLRDWLSRLMASGRAPAQGAQLSARQAEAADRLIAEGNRAENEGRLREACELFTRKMLAEDALVGMSLTGALTPAGIGMTCLIPLVEAGFVDWIVSTGANLYHDTHFGIGLEMHRGRPHLDDTVLREAGVVRIYDILFDYEVLLETDAFFRRIMTAPLRGSDPVVVGVALGARSYDIVIGRGQLASLGARIAKLRPGAKVAIVSDKNVAALHLDAAVAAAKSGGAQVSTVVLPPGESTKSFEHLAGLCDELCALDLGAVLTRGTPDEVLHDPRVVERYLGNDQAAINRSGAAPSGKARGRRVRARA